MSSSSDICDTCLTKHTAPRCKWCEIRLVIPGKTYCAVDKWKGDFYWEDALPTLDEALTFMRKIKACIPHYA
jgi:hypothetical protein